MLVQRPSARTVTRRTLGLERLEIPSTLARVLAPVVRPCEVRIVRPTQSDPVVIHKASGEALAIWL